MQEESKKIPCERMSASEFRKLMEGQMSVSLVTIGRCKGCGICCKAIPLFKGAIDRCDLHLADRKIKEIWTPITRDKAIEINPRLALYQGDEKDFDYFTCNVLTDKGCPYHGTPQQPLICRDFPFYKRPPADNLTMAEHCGWRDWLKEIGVIKNEEETQEEAV